MIRNVEQNDWLIEGTARWFEDELFDLDNPYRLKEGFSIAAVLRSGLNAPADLSRPYQRFAFWKLIDGRCGVTKHNRWRSLLNGDFVASWGHDPDPTGIRNLSDWLFVWQCDFGTGNGVNSRYELETALLYYNFATLGINTDVLGYDGGDMSVLEKDEVFVDPTGQSQLLCSLATPWESFLCFDGAERLYIDSQNPWEPRVGNDSLNSTATRSYVLESETIPRGQQAVVSVLSKGGDAKVVLASNDSSNFIKVTENMTLDGEQHGTFWSVAFTASSPKPSTYVYARATDEAPGQAPQVFLTVINPSLDEDSQIDTVVEVYIEECPGASCGVDSPTTYNWQVGNWGSCSGECGVGQGTQTRSAVCKSDAGVTVADSKCSGPKPTETRSCTASQCLAYAWQRGAWSDCSGPCGTNNASQTRTVTCQSGTGEQVADSYCVGPIPPVERQCTARECPITTNLLAHYEFEGNTKDAQGRYDATGRGGLAYDTGVIGRAARFDGANDYVEMPDLDTVLNFDRDWTISFWVKREPNANTASNSFFRGGDGGSRSKQFAISHGYTKISYRADTSADWRVDFAPVPENTWTHYALTWSASGRLAVYINGTLAGEDTQGELHDFYPDNYPPILGGLNYNRGQAQFFRGLMDDFRIYGRALTPIEVFALAD